MKLLFSQIPLVSLFLPFLTVFAIDASALDTASDAEPRIRPPADLNITTHRIPYTFSDGRTVELEVRVSEGDPGGKVIGQLPGLDEQAKSWFSTMREMRAESKAQGLPRPTQIAISMRGQGGTRGDELTKFSGNPPDRFIVADQANAVAAVFEKLGVKDVHLMAHSYGGLVAMKVASISKSVNIKSLQLIAPYASNFDRYRPKGTLAETMASCMMSCAVDALKAMNPIAYHEIAKTNLGQFFETAKSEGRLSTDTDEWTSRRLSMLSSMTLGADAESTDSLLKSLQERKIKVNILAAGKDGLVPLEAHEALQNSIPENVKGSELAIAEGVGHRATKEAPRSVAQWASENIARDTSTLAAEARAERRAQMTDRKLERLNREVSLQEAARRMGGRGMEIERGAR